MDKSQLIKSLLDGEKPSKQTYIFAWENKKVTETLGFFKIEVMDTKQEILFKFKIQIDLTTEKNKSDYAKIPIGSSEVYVGLVELESKSFFSKIKEGIESAISSGKIPFLPGS